MACLRRHGPAGRRSGRSSARSPQQPGGTKRRSNHLPPCERSSLMSSHSQGGNPKNTPPGSPDDFEEKSARKGCHYPQFCSSVIPNSFRRFIPFFSAHRGYYFLTWRTDDAEKLERIIIMNKLSANSVSLWYILFQSIRKRSLSQLFERESRESSASDS